MLASPGQDVRDMLSKIFQDSGELRKKLQIRKTICLGNNTRSYSCILFFSYGLQCGFICLRNMGGCFKSSLTCWLFQLNIIYNIWQQVTTKSAWSSFQICLGAEKQRMHYQFNYKLRKRIQTHYFHSGTNSDNFLAFFLSFQWYNPIIIHGTVSMGISFALDSKRKKQNVTYYNKITNGEKHSDLASASELPILT